jgi:hypothetical protein
MRSWAFRIALAFCALSGEGILHGAHYVAKLLPAPAASPFQSSWAYGLSGGRFAGTIAKASYLDEFHAAYWSDATSGVIDLHPPQFEDSEALAVSGSTQVGYGTGGVAGDYYHPVMWTGSVASAIDLLPSGYFDGQAHAVLGERQGGYVRPDDGEGGQQSSHAVVWHGSAEGYVDLTPPGFTAAIWGLSSGSEVGTGGAIGSGHGHALLWHGSAASVVDLHPGGFPQSAALNATDEVQVGFVRGATGNSDHAALWRGSAATFVDLNPPGFEYSRALGAAGARQVGVGQPLAGQPHALLWNGSAASVIDLHESAMHLIDFVAGTRAYDIDENGNVAGIIWGASDDARAVVWTRVPEPASAICFLTSLLMTVGRARRWK